MLPVALYQCCQLDPVDLLEGVKRSEADTRVFSLSSANIALCLRAQRLLLKASANVAAISLLRYECGEPGFVGSCADRVYAVSSSGLLRLDDELTSDPLRPLPLASCQAASVLEIAIGNRSVELCAACKQRLLSAVRRARQDIWSRLPTFFDLWKLEPQIRMVINDPLVRDQDYQSDLYATKNLRCHWTESMTA
ncbi:hypothetical protein BD310DRAFT_940263 [Dichomitus squalens]|uniref:Uncharacterized protein n=1 Tax=Dichomitus squalens TaxID=114155 RepID=A0A4Q9PCH4_9APHY|nr:hypothetical protein BD310DRAFT_940263 [Dichomitus squalens]